MTSLNLIYTFDFPLGETIIRAVENSKASFGVTVVSRENLINECIIKFDDGTVWACYKPYMYRAKLSQKWDTCLFDNKSIDNTNSNALNYIINNHNAGGKIEYFN